MARIATREDWLDARKALLEEEKAFQKARDALAAKRRALPWVAVETDYRFRGPEGEMSLRDLFGDHVRTRLKFEKPRSKGKWKD